MVEILENRLIEQCREGDRAAFGDLVKLYRRQLYSYLIKMSGDRTAAEDLFQDTLIKVWNGIKKYDDRQKFSSWLFSIAHNCSIDYLRKRKLAMNTFVELKEDSARAKDMHDIIVTKELKEKIDRTVDMLPEKQKQVFVMRQFSDLSFKEISKIMNEPLNTVLSHMHYAVKKIKIALGNEYAENR